MACLATLRTPRCTKLDQSVIDTIQLVSFSCKWRENQIVLEHSNSSCSQNIYFWKPSISMFMTSMWTYCHMNALNTCDVCPTRPQFYCVFKAGFFSRCYASWLMNVARRLGNNTSMNIQRKISRILVISHVENRARYESWNLNLNSAMSRLEVSE